VAGVVAGPSRAKHGDAGEGARLIDEALARGGRASLAPQLALALVVVLFTAFAIVSRA
jgi:hypothetical protein